MGLEEHLTEEQQLEQIKLVEGYYEQSANWQSIVKRHGKFAPLHHPYADLANTMQGHYILMSLSRPKSMRQSDLENCDRLTQIIMAEGGSIKFDREYEPHWVGLVTEPSPIALLTAGITHATWEKRVVHYLQQQAMPALEEALQLPDTNETEERVGHVHHDLLGLAAYVQTFLIAKTRGLEAIKPLIPTLQAGELVYKG